MTEHAEDCFAGLARNLRIWVELDQDAYQFGSPRSIGLFSEECAEHVTDLAPFIGFGPEMDYPVRELRGNPAVCFLGEECMEHVTDLASFMGSGSEFEYPGCQLCRHRCVRLTGEL